MELKLRNIPDSVILKSSYVEIRQFDFNICH